jgi:hypothetical protein
MLDLSLINIVVRKHKRKIKSIQIHNMSLISMIMGIMFSHRFDSHNSLILL